MTNLSSNEKRSKNIMQDFNEYSKNFKNESVGDTEKSIMDLVKNLSKKFDGKSQNDLLKAIYEEALKGKQNGTLSNEQIDAFYKVLAPMLDDKKRKLLGKVVEEIKKI